MSQLRTSFGDQQVVPTIFLIEVRSLRITAARALPQGFAGCQLLTGLGVYLTERDGIVGIRDHVAFAVLKPQRGVDTLLLQPEGVTPGAPRVLGRHQEVAAVAHIGGNHIIGALMVANRRGIDAQPGVSSFQRQLTLTVEHITDQLPIDQVLGVIDGYTRERTEGRVHQIEVIPYPAHAGVGVITGNNGITQLCPRGQRE